MARKPTALRSRGERTTEGWIRLRDTGVEHSDGVEDAILAVVLDESDLRSTSSELISRAGGSAEASQLDPARANIIRGLSIPPGAKVLQVGAGMGAVTRLLGERAHLVDALEPVAGRARVARARTRDLPGVEVFVGDHADIPDEPCYDVVVALGVLEHVSNGGADREPYVAVLRRLAGCLVDGGTLVLASENGIGVTYPVDAPEVPADEAFDSIERYSATPLARTFSRRELEAMFVEVGLEPTVRVAFPDCRLTSAVIDADALADEAPALLRNLPALPSSDPCSRHQPLPDEGRVWEALVDAGLGAEVGDSFLVLAGKGAPQGLWPTELLATYYSRERKEHYTFEKRVVRESEGIRISRRRLGREDPSALIGVTDGDEPFVDGPTILEAVRARPDLAAGLLRQWYAALRDEHAGADQIPVDFVPNTIVVRPDASLDPIGQGWTAAGWSLDRVVRRGVLWFAAHLARRTPSSRWPDHPNSRSLAVMYGRFIGLGERGDWVDLAIAEEAELCAEIGLPVGAETRDEAINRISADLAAMMDVPLSTLTFGEPLPSMFDRVLAQLASAVEGRANAEKQRDDVRGLLAEARANRSPGDPSPETVALRAELDAIHRSRSWRVARKYYALVERIAPGGTARRRAYGRIMRGAVRPAVVVRNVVNSLQSAPIQVEVEPESLVLATDSNPTASVVIPVYGQWGVTAQCLRSFMEHPPSVPYEVVVVDDASRDDTRERLAEVTGVRVVALDENRGFIGATNAGIEASRGEYVVMLNNDTQITDGWLEALIAAVSAPGVGLAGSKLVYPDGRLQEAGGIIFANAGGWNYGRFDNPALERYNVARDVDYCSGAAIILRRDLLSDLGNLDPRFAPAYFDDVDLAFSVRERGLRVVYEPKAMVIHHEGVSHGTDTSSGIKAYQQINQGKFIDKWAHRLVDHYPQVEALVPEAARRLDGKGTIVVVDDHVPRPDEDAGSVRMLGLLTALRRLGWSVIFIPDNRYHGDVWGRHLLAEGIEVFCGPEPVDQFLASIRGRVKAVIGSRVTVAWPYIGIVRRVMPGVPFLFDTVDLHHVRARREAELSGDKTAMARALHTRSLELGFVQAADETLVVSPTEVAILAEEVPEAKVAVVPLVHERRLEPPGPEGRRGIVFVGSFAHPPNADAVRWFITEIFPIVRAELPDERLQIVGKEVPNDVAAMACEGVDVLGWLPTLDDVYARCRVVVAPLRFGAGLKGKVAEALSHGVPVVVTEIAAEGMGIEHGESGWVADDPVDFAQGVIALVQDDDLWARFAVSGQELIEESLGVARFEQLVAKALEAVGVADGDLSEGVRAGPSSTSSASSI